MSDICSCKQPDVVNYKQTGLLYCKICTKWWDAKYSNPQALPSGFFEYKPPHPTTVPYRYKGKPIVHKLRKVGRNEPCPCGSGHKFKKCCINLPEWKRV